MIKNQCHFYFYNFEKRYVDITVQSVPTKPINQLKDIRIYSKEIFQR